MTLSAFGGVVRTANSSAVKHLRASPSQLRARWAEASSDISISAGAKPRSGSLIACSISCRMSCSESGSSWKTWERETSGLLM